MIQGHKLYSGLFGCKVGTWPTTYTWVVLLMITRDFLFFFFEKKNSEGLRESNTGTCGGTIKGVGANTNQDFLFLESHCGEGGNKTCVVGGNPLSQKEVIIPLSLSRHLSLIFVYYLSIFNIPTKVSGRLNVYFGISAGKAARRIRVPTY